MFLLNLIPAPLRVYFFLALAAGLIATGWYAHVVFSGYLQNNDKKVAIENLGKGQRDIINFNQEFDKEARDVEQNAKDDCMGKPIPNSIRLLLSPH